MTGRMGRAGTWGVGGVRQRTSDANWLKPFAWARLARTGLLPNRTPSKGRRPRVFCASLADVFEDRPEVGHWRLELFEMIEQTPELDWLVLTKRPDIARDHLREVYDHGYGEQGAPTPNIWVGTSIENSRFTWRADVLREVPAAVRFISAEPLLGSLFPQDRGLPDKPGGVTGSRAAQSGALGATPDAQGPRSRAPLDLTGIDWLISGGESGGRFARPMHPDWARELRDACAANGVAYHHKQAGAYRPARQDERVDFTFPDGLAMHYVGASPKAAGKLLDGVDHCAFPDRELTPA